MNWRTEQTAVYTVIRDGDGQNVAFISISDRSREVGRLLAKAPEMRDMLKVVVREKCFACNCGVSADIFEKIEKLIKEIDQ